MADNPMAILTLSTGRPRWPTRRIPEPTRSNQAPSPPGSRRAAASRSVRNLPPSRGHDTAHQARRLATDVGETELTWDESTDDLDPQWVLAYRVYVNDVLDHTLSLRNTRTIVYGTLDGANTFAVTATDSAGNESAPTTVTAHLDCVP